MRLLLLLALLASAGAARAAPPTVPAGLDALGMHLTLDADARALVQAKVNSLCRHPASLQARVALAEAAFPLIDATLAEEGVPADFRYLAVQESALHGNAESAHGAVGYWQLKRETALSLGLLVNSSVDERRHLTASTHAAARYLARNYAALHSWASALLSYNLGLGGARAVLRPPDAEAATLALTGSSNPYVLAFVAHKLVFEPAVAAGTVPFVPWQEITAAPGQQLPQQAAALGLDPAAFALLNPWLLAAAVPADGHRYTWLLPAPTGTAPAAPATPAAPTMPVAAFERVNGLKALAAQPGETAAELATRGGASVGFFEKINELTPGEALQAGAWYFFQRKKEIADEDYHVVQPGQSLAAVAQHYGLLLHALRGYNHLPATTDARAPLRPGLVLWLSHARPRSQPPQVEPITQVSVPTAAPRPPAPASSPASDTHDDELADLNDLPTEVPGAPVADLPSRPAALPAGPATRPLPTPAVAPVAVATLPTPATTHRVAAGETLYSLARLAATTPAELAAWNNLAPTAPLHLGQLLRLLPPAGAMPARQAAPARPALPQPATAAGSGTYTVAVGDTLYGIARRYNCTVAEILTHNGKHEPTLRVGETLLVPQR